MKEATGRQGLTYYLTADKRFIIKTLTREEVEEMHHILKHYHEVSNGRMMGGQINRRICLNGFIPWNFPNDRCSIHIESHVGVSFASQLIDQIYACCAMIAATAQIARN